MLYLHIAVIVLARPYESTRRFDCLSDHIIDLGQTVSIKSDVISWLPRTYQAVLVPQTCCFKIFLVRFLVNVLKDILEAPIIFLQDGVLGRHILKKKSYHWNGQINMRRLTNGIFFSSAILNEAWANPSID
jgi:hypothetical protein